MLCICHVEQPFLNGKEQNVQVLIIEERTPTWYEIVKWYGPVNQVEAIAVKCRNKDRTFKLTEVSKEIDFRDLVLILYKGL